jgi:hypothetical protein
MLQKILKLAYFKIPALSKSLFTQTLGLAPYAKSPVNTGLFDLEFEIYRATNPACRSESASLQPPNHSERASVA